MKKTAREILKEVLVKYYDPTNDSIIGEGVYSLDQAADKILADLSELVMGEKKEYFECDYPIIRFYDGYNEALTDISKLFATDKEEKIKCESDGQIYTSYPPQYRCKRCLRWWFCHEPIPECTDKEEQ